MRAGRIALTACAIACASNPSPRWQEGGAALALDSAYWSRQSSTIEVRPSGEIIEDDTLLFRLDRAGRLSDADGKPVAVLASDGSLIAEDDTLIGWVGVAAAYRADRQTPSVWMYPSGQALVSHEDGAWSSAGKWDYCTGPMLRTCTLVTHVVTARDRAERKRSGGSSSSNLGDVLRLLELLKIAR